MDKSAHYQKLESMYLAGPINSAFQPEIKVSEGRAEIQIALSDRYHHAAGAVHGSIYFKMLDDAAFFAANSLEERRFVLTTAFTVYLTRPVTAGVMRAVGRVVNRTSSQFIAEAVVYDGDGQEIGRGNGVFVRGRTLLTEAMGYNEQ